MASTGSAKTVRLLLISRGVISNESNARKV
jgi:hypothetical protein